MEPLYVFKGKTAIWFYGVLIACVVMPLMPILSGNASILSFLILGVIVLVDAFLISTIIWNRVELYEDHFVYYYSFSKTTISYASIKQLERTHSPIASSANSLDRIYIDTGNDELYVALKENDAFIQTVHALKKQAENKS